MTVELKIKSKHLALEPAIIRKEERKLSKRIKNYKQYHQLSNDGLFIYYKEHPELYALWSKQSSLISHRVLNVRHEARATYLARAYIKGVPYKVVEANSKDEPLHNMVMSSLIRMVMKYGSTRYFSDVDRSVVPFKVIKTAENKAKDDILAWLKQ